MVTNQPEFSVHQKRKFFQDGYLKVTGAIPQKLINMALRSINYSVGMGIDPGKIETFRANSFCPELRRSQAILDLLDQTPLWSLANSLTAPGKLKLYADPQIALRFPIMQVPGEYHPHLDGMYRSGNRVPRGKIESFTMLIGVMLNDTPNRYWGNFTVWPGTHRTYEQYFRENGWRSLLRGMPKVKLPAPEQVLAKAGDVIICHYQLAHTVVSNVSPYIRYAVFFRMVHSEHKKFGDRVFTDIWLEWPGVREVAEEA